MNEDAFESLSWGNDDGTSCEARFRDFYIYQCGESYWRIVTTGNEDLVEEGDGEESLREAFARLVKSSNESKERVL